MKKVLKNILISILFVAFVVGIFLLLKSIILINPDQIAEITEHVVIDDFKGENFSSPKDFRENSIKGPQEVDISSYKLNVTGLLDNPLSLSYEDVINNFESYQKVATLNCVEGWSVKILWEGVEVRDLLKQGGLKEGTKTIIFKAVDGYSTSFPIEYILDNNIIMAHKMNEETLLPERGFPFQLVAESKWGYKWIKWISEIEISDNEDYRGFWESRGYNNDGSFPGPRYE